MDATESQRVASSTPTIRKGWWQRVRRAIVLYVLVPYLAVTLIFVIFQRKLMYRPKVTESLRAAAVGLDPELVRDVQLQTLDGDTLNGWLLKQTEPVVFSVKS